MRRPYSTQELIDMLTAAGIRPSSQRLAVLGHLVASESHPSAEEIYNALSATQPLISRATVYNTVKLLVSKKVVDVVNSDPDELRFDYIAVPHAHFQCRCCHKIIDVDVDMASLPHPESDMFVIDNVSLYYDGLCADCLKKSKQ